MSDETINDAVVGRPGQHGSGDALDPRRAFSKSGGSGSGGFLSGAESYGATIADGGSSGVGGGSTGVVGGYQVIRRIGGGGMGSVFLARDPRTRRWVAIKRLADQFVADAQLRSRFETEAQSVAALSHFHIVTLYAMADDAQGPYLALEYVGGPQASQASGSDGWPADLPNPPLDLDQLIARRGPMEVDRVRELGIKLCSALAYAHKQGVVHRDIKPANILMSEELEPKITDFGLAKQHGEARADESHTLAGARLLTPYYGAPEQEIDGSKVDHRADIYGLGTTLWYALTAESPRGFRESQIPPPLRPILIKAMSKDREQRYQSASEMMDALQRAAPSSSRQTPTASIGRTAAGTTAPGKCPKCSHEHPIDPKDPLGRKFCESCGTSLVEKCQACQTYNGVWSRYCGKCGSDLAEAAAKAHEVCREDQRMVMAMLESSQFPKAISMIEEISGLKHPRLSEFSEWARNLLPEAKSRFEAAKKERESLLEKARHLTAEFRYGDAMAALQAIPPPMRTPDSDGLARSLRTKIQSCESLSAKIAEQTKALDIDGLRLSLEELLQLLPKDPTALRLRQQLKQRDQKNHDRAWLKAKTEESIAGYQSYMSVYPDGPHIQKARRRLAPLLRQELLSEPKNLPIRSKYLELRTTDLCGEDEKHARIRLSVCFGIFGALVGLVVGIAFGLATNALIAAAVAAVASQLIIWALAKHVSWNKSASDKALGIVGIALTIAIIFAFANAKSSDSDSSPGLVGGALGFFVGGIAGSLWTFFLGPFCEKAQFGPLPLVGYMLPAGKAAKLFGLQISSTPARKPIASSSSPAPWPPAMDNGTAVRDVGANLCRLTVNVAGCTLGIYFPGSIEVAGNVVRRANRRPFSCQFAIPPGQHMINTKAAGIFVGKYLVTLPSSGNYELKLGTAEMAGTGSVVKQLAVRRVN